MENKLHQNEVVEDLCLDGLKIIQNAGLYRFTSDAVILANFVRAKRTDALLDIGTGSGIVAILAAHKNNLSDAIGVEIQPQMADMARRSVALNKMEDRIKIVNADIKDFHKLCSKVFDVITCNPPYKKAQAGKVNDCESKSIARHEVALDLPALCKAANRLLKFGGKFYVCMDAVRAAELLFELKNAGLEPKKMFFTQSSPQSEGKILFVQAQKGAKAGIRVLPALITNDLDGSYLETVKKMRF